MSANLTTIPSSKCIIPFWGTIPGGLCAGKMVEILGCVPPGNGDMFDINFMNFHDDGSKKSDRPLHISIRPNNRIVIRNVLKNGSWGREERDGGYPFASGSQFLICILVEQSAYRIAVNCQHQWEFHHRLPFESVTILHISGPVRIDEIRYRKPHVDPVPYAYGARHHQFPADAKPVINPTIPFYYPVSEGFRPGLMIYISGRPIGNAKRFTINLTCSRCPYPPPEDIALHIDARIPNSTIVRNTQVNSNWGQEEKSAPYFPFVPGVYFDMIIRTENDKFMVAISGQHFFEYFHRIFPISAINQLSILGDVVVTSLRIVST